jgi:hypothetical protein
MYGCARTDSRSYPELQLTQTELSGPPTPDPFHFEPVRSTQAEILAYHQDERSSVYSKPVQMVDGNPTLSALGDRQDISAVLISSGEGSQTQIVEIVRSGETIFKTSAGLPSPVLPLQGLWTYDGHWALEILLADEDTWAGQIFLDGELINDAEDYDEAFGLQLLGGQPFFFFRREGNIGYWYNGQEKNLEYDEILHYRCCSESTLNPIQAINMVAFFAAKDSIWSYVELGAFNQ